MDQNVIFPTEARVAMGSGRCQPLAIQNAMRITSADPATIEDRKKYTGRTGVHHCGASMFGISRYSDPNELWCIVDSVTAAIASRMGSNAVLGRSRKIHAMVPKIRSVTAAYTGLRDIIQMKSVTANAT